MDRRLVSGPPLKPLVIRASPWKSLLLLAGCAAFTAMGAFLLVRDADAFWSGLFCTLLFGAGTVVALMTLLSPPTLTLERDGFTHKGLGGRRFSAAWDDIEGFHVWANPSARTQRMVAWTLKPGRAKPGLLAKMNRSMGIDGALPGGWAMPPARLVELMEQWRRDAAAGSADRDGGRGW